jgi:hypothetical protein
MRRGAQPTTPAEQTRPATAWWRLAEAACARLTTPVLDTATADRELAQLLRCSRLGSSLDFVTRAAEAAWRESRTRRTLLWLRGGE